MAETKRPSTAPRGASAPTLNGNHSRSHAGNAAPSLDETDRAIIRILQDDGRTAFTTIAKQLDMSEGAVRNRVGQLIDSKLLRIIGVADPFSFGYNAYAMLGIKVAPGFDPQESAFYFRDRDEVTYVIFVAGRYDLLVEVICETHDQLSLFLREHCHSRADLVSVEPMVGLAMYKNMLKWGQP